jgi:hypothetical protein
MSSSKDKGTRAETAIARFLQAVGFKHAERRALNGTQDRGDIAGLPGIVIEVKNCARQELAAWVTEAETERDRDGASLGVVWHKRRGKADPRDWFVTMSGLQFAHLLREHMELPPLKAPADKEQPTMRRSLLTLATPCAACAHPYNWHSASGCQADRCDCIAFAQGGEDGTA